MTLRARRVFLGWIRDRYGFAAAAGHVGRFRRDGTALLAVRNAPPVVVRPGTADLHVFDEVFGQNGYGFDLASSPSVIVDAGAHIGLTAAHFAARYPSAAILALEPEAGNFAVLEQQSNYHPRIIPVRAGLWWRTAHVAVVNPDAATWSFRIEESTAPNAVPAISIPELLSRYKIDRIDLLKIDIEGAECDVLPHAHEWIDRVDTLVVELHDRHRPGCSAALSTAIHGQHFERQQVGENVVLTRSKTAIRQAAHRLVHALTAMCVAGWSDTIPVDLLLSFCA